MEVQLARMDERMQTMVEEMRLSRESRTKLHTSIDQMNVSVSKLDGRVAGVEASLASAQPTIQEFITIKHKVVGAGALGKWLWIAGGALLGAVAVSREHIINFLKGG